MRRANEPLMQGAIPKAKGKGTFGHPEVFRADNRVACTR